MTSVVDLESLDATQMAHLGSVLLARAETRRAGTLTPTQADEALDMVELELGQGSPLEHLLRGRAAARRLHLQGVHGDAFRQPLKAAVAKRCLDCAGHGLHHTAVEAGIEDALRERGGSGVTAAVSVLTGVITESMTMRPSRGRPWCVGRLLDSHGRATEIVVFGESSTAKATSELTEGTRVRVWACTQLRNYSDRRGPHSGLRYVLESWAVIDQEVAA